MPNIGSKRFGFIAGSLVSGRYQEIDECYAKFLGNGYTLKYKIEDLTDVDKLETITTLKRGDTTNQNPVIYETGNLLY